MLTNNDLARLLKTLEDDQGRITPEALVDAARPESHPLHELFTWDDHLAAEKYRLTEARHLIRSVKIEFETEERTISVVKYVRDPEMEGGTQGYKRIDSMKEDEPCALSVVQRELSQAISHLKRAESIAATLGSDYESAIGTALRSLMRATSKFQSSGASAGAAAHV